MVGNVSIPLVGGVPVDELVAVPCGLAGSACTGRALLALLGPSVWVWVWVCICSVEFLSELALDEGGCDDDTTLYLLPFRDAYAVADPDPAPFSFGFVASV